MVTGVTLKGIRKSFQSRGRLVTPLKDFSLNLEPGKLTAVLGKSGCGKTTLLKVISGLEERDAGEISFFDEAGRSVSNPKLSLVFQDPRLLPWKTVEENLSLAIRHLPEEERRQRIREVLELVRLPEVEALYPSELWRYGAARRVGTGNHRKTGPAAVRRTIQCAGFYDAQPPPNGFLQDPG